MCQELKKVLEDFKSEMEDIKSTQRIIQECCSYSKNVFVVPISNTDSLSQGCELELELEKIFFLNSNLNSNKTVRVRVH